MSLSLPGVRTVHVRPQVGRVLVRADDGEGRDARALPPARRADGPRGVQLRAARRAPPSVCVPQAALATHRTHQQPHCHRRRRPGMHEESSNTRTSVVYLCEENLLSAVLLLLTGNPRRPQASASCEQAFNHFCQYVEFIILNF